jgi:regulatory protein
MRIITKINRQVKNKNRVSIFVDDSYFASLDEKTFLNSGLKTGDTLDELVWDELFMQKENEAALNKAVAYISRLLRSEKQVRENLAKKGFETPAIDYAIDKMKEYKYIDDESFANMILSHQINVKNVGLMAVRQALYKNGISQELIDKMLLQYDIEKQYENAKIIVEKLKKRYRNIEDEKEKKRKISQNMARRGYSWDQINSAMANQD